MAIVQPSTGQAPVVPDGLYEVTCIDLEEKVFEDDGYGNKNVTKLAVFLQVHGTDDGEGKESVISPLISLKWSPGGKYPASNLYLYAHAFGVAGSDEEPFETERLRGERAQALVTTEAPGKWPKVEKMLPLQGKVKPVTVAKDVQPEPTADDKFTKFWNRVRAAGHDRAAVIGIVGDIENIVKMSDLQLEAVLKTLEAGAPEPIEKAPVAH